MKTSSAKAKGRRPMLWLRERLLATFPQLQPDDIRVTPSGTPGPDLQLSPAAQRCWPFATESKNTERLRLWPALNQAATHAEAMGLAPCLVFTKNRAGVWAIVTDEWLHSIPHPFVYDPTWWCGEAMPLWRIIRETQGRAGAHAYALIRFSRRSALHKVYAALEAETLLALLKERMP